MFDNLSEKLSRTLKNISGQGRITEDNIKDTLREVRTALLEADVALSVVKDFTTKVKEQALGTIVSTSLTPGQEFVRIVHDQLVQTMGAENAALNVAHQPPAVILLAGLQGAGKTTSAAKLGLYIKERLKKSVLMCSVDPYRPAAIEQLHTLGRETAIQKMKWSEDGWLRMADGSNLAKLEVEEPGLSDVPMPQIPSHDDFDVFDYEADDSAPVE